MNFILVRFIPAIIYLILITVLFCLPGSTFADADQDWLKVYHVDKLVHAVLFAILVFLFCRPIQLRGHLTKALLVIYFLILVIAIIYGVVIEFIQMAIPGRGFDGLDILADSIGAYIGYRIAKNIIKKQKPASLDELKKEAMDYAKEYVGDKVNLDKIIPGAKDLLSKDKKQ